MKRTQFSNLPKKAKTGPKPGFTKRDLKDVTLLAKLGASQKQIAEYFETGIDNVEYWMKKHPVFHAAVKRGSIIPDMKVANSLYKRAVGIEYIEEEYTAIEVKGKKVPLSEMALVRRTKKWLPPEVKAIIHWLRIRQREVWSVVPEMLHKHTGNISHLHRKLQDIPVQELTEDAQKFLFEIVQKQLSVDNREN